MSMQINGGYSPFKTNYAEQLKAEPPVRRVEEEKEYEDAKVSDVKPTGLYRLEEDESGKRKVFFDDPKKPVRKCTTNTDQVDREIEKLKEKQKQLEQQIR